MGVVVQMGDEPIDALFAAQYSCFRFPFPTVAEQIGREPAVRCQQALNVRIHKFWWWHGFTGGGSCSIPLLRWRRFKWRLYGTAMGGNGDIVVATVAFLPPTFVRVFSVHNVDGATVQTFPLFSAGLGGSMECQALRAVKGKIALLADDGRLLEHVVVRAWCGLVPVAGPASSAFAGMVSRVVLVETAITFMAPI